MRKFVLKKPNMSSQPSISLGTKEEDKEGLNILLRVVIFFYQFQTIPFGLYKKEDKYIHTTYLVYSLSVFFIILNMEYMLHCMDE